MYWSRRHVHFSNGRQIFQYEKYYAKPSTEYATNTDARKHTSKWFRWRQIERIGYELVFVKRILCWFANKTKWPPKVLCLILQFSVTRVWHGIAWCHESNEIDNFYVGKNVEIFICSIFARHKFRLVLAWILYAVAVRVANPNRLFVEYCFFREEVKRDSETSNGVYIYNRYFDENIRDWVLDARHLQK